ncbi:MULTISPECIES: TetR/AcrR family transcriptional regulator [Streptomyces]|uniref:TetR/AcrR family transcriptional regulator n=2 Tax=Streptomyces TaxID=1883 RepID=A0ABV9IU18_9ACTN
MNTQGRESSPGPVGTATAGTGEKAGTPGRPRHPELDQAILHATVDIVVLRGFVGATVEAIARQAGTGKGAVYRRWPDKISLVIAAMRARVYEVAVPDTGSLREDLRTCVLHYAWGDRHGARFLANVLSEAPRDTALLEAAVEAMEGAPSTALQSVIRRWVARGEIAPSVPVELLTTLVSALALRQVLLHGRCIDTGTVADLVDHVLLPALRRT